MAIDNQQWQQILNAMLTASRASRTLPLFTKEGPQVYQQAFQHNAPFAVPGPYQTQLTPSEELEFRKWLTERNVPFDPDAALMDYDMRGFWKNEPEQAAVWRLGKHFPDMYKTPYDATFSKESKYATPDAPFVWEGDNLVDTRAGQLIFGNKLR